MEQYFRELYCSRILAGYIRYKELRIYWPSKDVLYDSCEVYKEVYEESRFQGLMTNQELLHELSVIGLWEPELDFELKSLGETLDSLKIEAYHNINKSSLKSTKMKIEQTKGRMTKLLVKKHQYGDITCEGVATFAKWVFILENSVFTRDMVPARNENLLSLLDHWNASRISDEHIRELARTEPWQTYWQSKTGQFFSVPDCELTDEQRRIVIWTKLYDNIREHGDAPDESVINDDDALDGWMLIQKREREKAKTEKQTESKIHSEKIRGSQDIMVKAWTKEDAEKITSLNNESSNLLRKTRMKQINKQGTVDGSQLSDLKLRKLQKRG